jgi:flagellar motor switch protein FliG
MVKEKSADELGKIEQADGEMHQQIKDLLFVFDNLLAVDDRGIQAVLREVGSDALALALRGAEPDVQDKIMKNMSKRAAEILRDDMEARGPVKLAEVEAAQKEIVVIAQRLAEEGTISLGGKDAAGDYV